MDPNNPHWGWSWLERRMAARPWEGRSIITDHNDRASVKSSASHTVSVGEIFKMHSLNHDNNKPSPVGQKATRRPTTYNSPSTPASKAPSPSPANAKARPSSSKGSSAWGGDDDSIRSMLSVRSERYRRYSIAGSSMRGDDHDSVESSPAFPSYMALTSSAKARSKAQRPSSPSSSTIDRNGRTPESGASVVSSARKRLSFPASPAGSRRHSGPPKVEMFSNKDGGAYYHL